MSKVNLDSLLNNLGSQQLEQQIPAIEEATSIVETLAIKAVDSLETSSNRFLVAERLSNFGSVIIPHLEQLLDRATNFEVRVLASLVLFKLNSEIGVPILLNSIRDDDEYAMLSARHLAQANIKDAIEPICDRLRTSNLEEVDLIVSLLDSLEKLTSKLPQDILQRFISDDISWEIKTKLEEQYLSAKS